MHAALARKFGCTLETPCAQDFHSVMQLCDQAMMGARGEGGSKAITNTRCFIGPPGIHPSRQHMRCNMAAVMQTSTSPSAQTITCGYKLDRKQCWPVSTNDRNF